MNATMALRRMAVTVMMTVLTGSGSLRAGSLDPTNGPGPTMHSLEEIYQKVNHMGPAQSLSATTTAVTAGWYAGTTLETVDPDLAPGNIRAGVVLFGVAGDSNVVNTSSGDASAGDVMTGRKVWVDGREVTGTTNIQPRRALIPKTGQTTSAWPGDDGNLKRGVTWPTPRFTDHANGTVTDNLTGLMWLQKANCISNDYPSFDTDGTLGDGAVSWQHGLDFVAGMNSGTYTNCGHADWRVPTVLELLSIFDYGRHNPALPAGHPFTGVGNGDFAYWWTSTTRAGSTDWAWSVRMNFGIAWTTQKTSLFFVWPVRGGN